MSETVRALRASLHWLRLQIESFPVPIEEIIHVQAFTGTGADTAWRLSRRSIGHGRLRSF